jgi:hypothetical protein
LAAIVTENTTSAQGNAKSQGSGQRWPTATLDEMLADLGIWLSSLESFFSGGHAVFSTVTETEDGTRKEFELIQAVLLKCSGHAFLRLGEADGTAISSWELAALGAAIRDLVILGESLLTSEHLKAAEFRAWRSVVMEKLEGCSAYAKAADIAAESGRENLPSPLLTLVQEPKDEVQAELALILPRFGKVMRWLDVVGRMLAADEPLKPALVIFASVSEQVADLINSIDNRLERFENEEAELFSALDAAAYTASIELKKVFTQELSGISQLRPSPSIFAKMETAHSLLSDGFQQMLADFARSVDPTVDPVLLFPNFRVKQEQSVVLRRELYDLSALIQAAEKDPSKANVEKTRAALKKFMGQSIRYLFYKDTETIERFVEEIMIAQQNKDLVPMLHRFGAYLDTLFGQVCLRAVLAGHPFEP